jgi:hypothetical protein
MQRCAFGACRDVFEEPGMRATWRPLIVAAVVNLIVVAAAAAQTVIVTGPAASTVSRGEPTLAATVTADATA